MADDCKEPNWRERRKPSLYSQPWKPFSIRERLYIVKSHFSDTEGSYEVCISDMQGIWFEKTTSETFIQRAQELNPNLEAKTTYLLKHLRQHVEQQDKETIYNIIKDDIIDSNKLVLNVRTMLLPGVPFVWEFHCTTAGQEFVATHLVQPMLCMVAELQRRQLELHKLLRKKDAEIKDYKESGYKLSRRNLETEEFDDEAFSHKMILSHGFSDTVEHCGKYSFSDSAQELYYQVVMKKIWLQDQQLPEQEFPRGHGDSSLDSSTPGAGPVSCSTGLDDTETSSNVSPRGSPINVSVSDPTKSAGQNSPELSPSKELERQRREDLQKKLAAEAERKKRKRKKIEL